MKGNKVPLPLFAPEKGSVYQHYKEGDLYRVIDLALNSNTDEWMVIYAPEYEDPDAPLFTRPLSEWSEEVEWKSEKKMRFTQCT